MSWAARPPVPEEDRTQATVGTEINRLEVAPARVQLNVDEAAQQLLVTRVSPGGERDATTDSQFESTNPHVATVSSTGIVRALREGDCKIVVRVGDLKASVPVETRSVAPGRSVYFARDVVPVLTKLGCNSGGCHGKQSGQNGFKLSLLGYGAAHDYEAIVQQARGRRLFPADPERSLLLLKATATVPHGGGRRMDVGSDDYRVLLRWIQDGARPPRDDDPVVERVVVSPRNRVLSPSASQQLLVTAEFSDGTRRDVTRQAVYQSNQPEVADVADGGLITASQRGGLFAVMVRYGDEFDVFHGTSPFNTAELSDGGEWAKLEARLGDHPIDRHLLAAWRRLGIQPSPPVDDGAWIRRATLDLCGRLPAVEEVTDFLADRRPDKRSRLVDRLLETPEYASYFALKWADILQNRGRGYSTSKQRAGTTLFASWIRDSIATNKPYDQFVAEIITAVGSQAVNPPTVWYRTVRTPQDYVESVSQAFLGVRLQCAQCHHHPSERLSQDDYYGLAAVFGRVGRKGGFADAEVPTNEVIYLKAEGKTVQPRTGQVMQPRPLGGPDFELTRYDDPRRRFAEWMTAPENPYFARTMANRMWAHFFGRGIIDPIDDARSTNPPSNPELLDALTREFVDSGYDVKQLIRLCANSYAYCLTSIPNESNAGDVQSFARFYPQRLKAEVLLDSLSDVLEVPTEFSSGSGTFPAGTRAVELPDEAVPSQFLDVFGRPARTTACECERVDAPALSQALELVSSELIQKKLSSPTGYCARLAENGKAPVENVKEIFMRVFARPPRAEELAAAVDFLEGEPDARGAYQSLLWSLLATNEFLFTH